MDITVNIHSEICFYKINSALNNLLQNEIIDKDRHEYLVSAYAKMFNVLPHNV